MWYKPVLKVEDRNGVKALFVVMPNGRTQNVWDLSPNEISSDVLDAVANAIKIGFEAFRQLQDTDSLRIEVSVKYPSED